MSEIGSTRQAIAYTPREVIYMPDSLIGVVMWLARETRLAYAFYCQGANPMVV